MTFGHIELFVADPQRSRDFYRDALGFTVEAEQSERIIWMKKDHVEILLRPAAEIDAFPRYESAPFGFVLYTDDLAATSAELERRGIAFRGTVDSDKCLTFTDPDGHWFQLVDPNDH